MSIALPYVTELSINTKDTTVRVYQPGTDACSVPIHVYTDCTLILDHVIDAADLTIADGCTVTIQLIGENHIQNLKACGGFQTSVTICGTSREDTLHAEQIACAPGGSATTSAQLSFLSCSIFSKSIGCGMDGSDTSYWSSSATIASATPGSNASPLIMIQHAKVEVEGDLACGGDGVCSTGTWSACTSHGGSSGEVHIEDSEVSVTGDMSVGGKGGNGDVSSSYYKCVAGNTKRASDVRIMQQSNVTVNGNVATSKNLPGMSDGGTQRGLDGATVTISGSVLSAKDIASGGSGHQTVRYNIYSGAGTSYDVCGTAGGNGGTILASNATILCETAVCGANAGDYMNYEVSMYGTTSGDVDSVHHPLDGNGGKIISENSYFTIHTHAGAKGSRWNGYANPSTYADSQFLGGGFSGTLYGNVITTDMTALVESETQKGFVASTEIRNSLEQACAKCTIQTGSELAEQVITIQANDIAQQTKLDTSGTLYTYLAIGKEKLTIHGSKSYLATVMVKRSEALNIFRLTPYGWIAIDTDSVLIEANRYTYQNEHFAHQSSYTITGESAQNDVCVTSGEHHIFVDAATFDSLEVKGSSNVILHLNGHTTISNILVDEAATLQIVGNGSLTVQTLGHLNAPSGTILIKEGTVNVKNLGSAYGGKEITVSNPDQLTVENCHTTLRNEQGERLFLLTIGFATSGTYGLKLNQLQEEIQIDECLEYSMLLPENVYRLELSQGSFSYKGEILLNKPQYIFQSDLMLSIDNSIDTILIEDGNLTFDAQTIQAENSITIYQSDTMIHPIIVSQASVNITLDQVRADTPLHLCDDFQGNIQNHAGRTVLPVTIHTSYPLQEVFVVLDGVNYKFVTDE
ncbi:MAG: hypothetical protein J6B28_00180, partial [Eubacterium sp.]|nr:hypothetical protein [Eubacterium sp.]